jgi:DinB superfamily
MRDLLETARSLLGTTPGRWQSLVDSAPGELLQRCPADGEWSAAECLNHLLVTERYVFGERLHAILESRDMPAFDPEAPREPEPETTAQELVTALAAARARNLEVLSGLQAGDLERASRHPLYGMVPLHVILSTWAAHDLQHTVQAEEAMMQALLPGTGPFRFRFADHEVRR